MKRQDTAFGEKEKMILGLERILYDSVVKTEPRTIPKPSTHSNHSSTPSTTPPSNAKIYVFWLRMQDAYQRYRLPLIFVQLVGWIIFLALPFLSFDVFSLPYPGRFCVRHFSEHALYILFFYANYFYFIPQIWYKRGVIAYSITVILALVVLVLAANTIDFLIDHFPFHITLRFFIPAMIVFTMSAGLRALQDWLKSRERQRLLEEEKRAAELAFLRMQVNPHFLFNTLNNILALVRLKKPEAEDALLRLSDLMRYVLKSAKMKKVPLENELDFIRNFMHLHQLRTGPETQVDLQLPETDIVWCIEPLLLVGLVENAFKHGIGPGPNHLSLHITIAGEQLCVVAENTIPPSPVVPDETSGVGLENMRRRLQLVYPDAHQFLIAKTSTHFRCTLEFPLTLC